MSDDAAQLDRPRCGARCRRNDGAPCKRWPIKGATRCRQHGGVTPHKGKPNEARIVHGLRSRFIDEKYLPVAVEAAEDIEQTGGVNVLKWQAAAEEAKIARALAEYPEALATPEGADQLLKSEALLIKSIETRSRIEAERRAPAETTINLTVPTIGATNLILVRRVDGAQARLLEGAVDGASLIECDDGAWRPAREVELEDDMGRAWEPVE